jgi:hypothetical protein
VTARIATEQPGCQDVVNIGGYRPREVKRFAQPGLAVVCLYSYMKQLRVGSAGKRLDGGN